MTFSLVRMSKAIGHTLAVIPTDVRVCGGVRLCFGRIDTLEFGIWTNADVES
jgi:hypothetical protein